MTKQEFEIATASLQCSADVEKEKQLFYINSIKGSMAYRYEFVDNTNAYIQNTFLLLSLFDKLLISDEEYDDLIAYNIELSNYYKKKEGEKHVRRERRCNTYCRCNTCRNEGR